MRAYLDMDEVLTESIESVLVTLNRRYNKNFKANDIYNWDFTDRFPETTLEEIEEIFSSEEFFENLTWKKDAKEFLQKLYNENNVTIVTKGSRMNLLLKRKWLKEQEFENIDFIGLDHSQSKGEVDMSDGYFVDDNEDNLYESNAKYKILFENYPNKSWNSTWSGLRAKTFKPII